jgi:hypothetical protein
MGPARAGLVRDTLGSLAVLGVVAFTAFGLPLVDRSLPANRPVTAGVPFPVGGGVTVQPPAYASIDLTRTRPGRDRGTVLFLAGDVRLVVVVTPFRGSLDDSAKRLRRKIARTGSMPAGLEAPARTDRGVPGVQGTYTTDGPPGAYAVLVEDNRAVEVTAVGADPSGSVDTAVRSVTFEARSGP